MAEKHSLIVLIAMLAQKDQVRPHENQGIWTRKIDDSWEIRLNPHGQKTEGVPSHTAAVFYNGWPAGLINPGGGVIAAGKAANEETLTAAIEKVLMDGSH